MQVCKKSNQKPKIIIIVGPTASGKTSLAVQMAKEFSGEIISADSRQVYIGLDLGTGKEGESAQINLPQLGNVPARVIDDIPQYLVDLLLPQQTYTVADFQKQSAIMIDNIIMRQRIPFIVGGTNLYIQALTDGFQIPLADNGEMAMRQKLEKLSAKTLLAKLKKADPISYEKIDHQNLRRVIRALSVTLASGKPFSHQQKKLPQNYDILHLGIDLQRAELYQKIDKRVDDRLKMGMIEEVRSLLDSGVSPERLISLGLEYRFITNYLTGEIPSKEEMIEKLKFASHAYARRQITWLKNKMPIEWISNTEQAKSRIRIFLKRDY